MARGPVSRLTANATFADHGPGRSSLVDVWNQTPNFAAVIHVLGAKLFGEPGLLQAEFGHETKCKDSESEQPTHLTSTDGCAENRSQDNGPEVILIGPMGTGKSTIGKLLAERLGVPQVPMDKIRWDYYKPQGWSEERQQEIDAREGFAGVLIYWKPFEIVAVERALTEHRNCVMDFGAGHSVYVDEGFLERAKTALAPFPNVVLLLPSPDLDESVRLLRERGPQISGMHWNRFFLTHPSNRRLAKRVVYNGSKSPGETAAEISALLRRRDSR